MQWRPDMKKLESPAEMSPEYRDLLITLLTVQCDTEFASVQQLRPWVDMAPSINDRWAVSRVMMEEMRHGWQICQLLKSLAAEAVVQDLMWRKMGEHKLDSFNIPFDEWSDVVLFNFLVDRVGLFQLTEFKDCSFGPLHRAVDTMLEEERFHISTGKAALAKLCEEAEGRQQAQKAIYKWYPRALDMFGRAGSRRNEMARQFGIKKRKNEDARRDYVNEVTPLIAELGLELPPEELNRRIL